VPQSTLSFSRTVASLDPKPSAEELTDLLFRRSKAEAARIEGDELLVEVTPDRLDLLSEGGLHQHLEGLLGRRLGLPAIPRHDPEGPAPELIADPSVDPLRPAVAAILLEAPPGGSLDEGMLAEAVRFQELLHATIGLDRRTASLGIYPWARLRPPITYRSVPVDGLRFTPLDAEQPVDGPTFFEHHPLALRYGALGRVGGECLALLDADGRVLSLPPILNSREAGEARVGDRTLLLESTGQRAARVEDALGLLQLPFVARGWRVAPVRVGHPTRVDTGEALVRPRRMRLDHSTVATLLGVPLEDREVREAMERARLGIAPTEGGWSVEVPPWRPDLLGEVDLAEEVILARGLRVEEGRRPPSRTRGRRLPEQRLRAAMGERLLALGFVPLLSPVLVPEELTVLMEQDAVPLANPVSLELSRLRNRILIALVRVLSRNTRHAYPQRIAEVGPVVLRDPQRESGTRTSYRVGLAVAGEGAGFASAASLVDYLLRREQVAGVREPVDLPGTIRGRSALLRVAGEPVAEMGELHPRVLSKLGIPVPVAWAEVDLSTLAPLLGRASS